MPTKNLIMKGEVVGSDAEKRIKYLHGDEPNEQARLAVQHSILRNKCLDFYQFGERKSALEIGCGTGVLVKDLSEKFPGCAFCCIDQSSKQLDYARNLCAGNDQIVFAQADLEEEGFPFSDERFDTVYCRFLLEHLRHPLEVLKKVRQFMAPGGKIFLMEQNVNYFFADPPLPQFQKWINQYVTMLTGQGGDPHIGGKLFSLLNRAGYEKVEIGSVEQICYYGTEEFTAWISHIIQEVQSAKEMIKVMHQEVIDLIIQELNSFLSNKHSSTNFWWNLGTAENPG